MGRVSGCMKLIAQPSQEARSRALRHSAAWSLKLAEVAMIEAGFKTASLS
jgi:hypothetical protein